jgi:hypothetical protein
MDEDETSDDEPVGLYMLPWERCEAINDAPLRQTSHRLRSARARQRV